MIMHTKHFLTTYPQTTVIEKPSQNHVAAFKGKLPDELLDVWEMEGWGIFMNGFLRIINPTDFLVFMDENIEMNTPSIPFAVTAFGDLLLWLKDGYVEVINFRKGYREIVESGMDLFLNDTLLDFSYAIKELRSEQYTEAIDKLGIPDFDKCFGYFPLLSLGGNELITNLQIVDLNIHLEIMAQSIGGL